MKREKKGANPKYPYYFKYKSGEKWGKGPVSKVPRTIRSRGKTYTLDDPYHQMNAAKCHRTAKDYRSGGYRAICKTFPGFKYNYMYIATTKRTPKKYL